jgi:hypothetical protein
MAGLIGIRRALGLGRSLRHRIWTRRPRSSRYLPPFHIAGALFHLITRPLSAWQSGWLLSVSRLLRHRIWGRRPRRLRGLPLFHIAGALIHFVTRPLPPRQSGWLLSISGAGRDRGRSLRHRIWARRPRSSRYPFHIAGALVHLITRPLSAWQCSRWLRGVSRVGGGGGRGGVTCRRCR